MKIKVNSVSEYVDHIGSVNIDGGYWFRGVANFEYFPEPGFCWRGLSCSCEDNMVHDFLMSYKNYYDAELGPWEIYALMQHHGLPTRLLDWSESALIALFFALYNPGPSESERGVWVLDPYALNNQSVGQSVLFGPSAYSVNSIFSEGKEFNLDDYLPSEIFGNRNMAMVGKPVALSASRSIRRVSSQKGCFTVHGYKEGDRFMAENLAKKEFHFISFGNLSSDQRWQMFSVLESMGVDEEFVYQDLDHMCCRIKRRCAGAL